MLKVSIRGLSREKLGAFIREVGESGFRVDQIFGWLYGEMVEDFDSMVNISKKLRGLLSERYCLGGVPSFERYEASDGSSKLVFDLEDGSLVESVYIPTDKRVTLCVSSQVGCKYRCKFCRTGQMGFGRHLSVEEILLQVMVGKRVAKQSGRELSNLVFMGMGEPLDNLENVLGALRILLDRRGFDFSRRRVTVSSVGHVDGLRALGASGLGVQLAISLHSADDELRSELMPVNHRWNLAALSEALREYPLSDRERISIEYILIKGVNDSKSDGAKLVKFLHGLPAKVNLIAFNRFDGCEFEAPDSLVVRGFQEYLLSRGIHATLRESRGGDELAACGQLGGISSKGKIFG